MRTPSASHPAHRRVQLAEPQPTDQCYICERPRTRIPGELCRMFGRWACRDRVDCYSVWRRAQ